MPSAASGHTAKAIKLLFLGNSGSGKTGAFSSLAAAGYNLFILDFDNGMDPLLEFTEKVYLPRIQYETIQDKKILIANYMKASEPKGFERTVHLLDNWKDSADGSRYGVPAKWDLSTIVILDSLSLMGDLCMNFVLKKNAQNFPRIQDWGEAQNLMAGVIENLVHPSFTPHVIVSSHINWQTTSEGAIFGGQPSSIGQKLSEKIPKWFNMMVGANAIGKDRKIHTSPSNFMDYKFPKAGVADTYPLKTGLREIFKFYRGTEPGDSNPLPQKVT